MIDLSTTELRPNNGAVIKTTMSISICLVVLGRRHCCNATDQLFCGSFVVLPLALAFALKDLSVSGSVTLLPGTSVIAVTHPSRQVLAVAAALGAVAEVAAESRRHPKALQVIFTAEHCLYMTIV